MENKKSRVMGFEVGDNIEDRSAFIEQCDGTKRRKKGVVRTILDRTGTSATDFIGVCFEGDVGGSGCETCFVKAPIDKEKEVKSDG